MPEMTGEELINNLRQINKDIVVILQTGYAGQKPPKEMFEGITIQGYFNKTENTAELELIILSALRTVELIKEVKTHEEEKAIRNKKDEFFANKINHITGEINEKLMSIGGPSMVLEGFIDEGLVEEGRKEDFLKRIGYIKEAAEQIKEKMKALNISAHNEMMSADMLNTIYELFKIELSFENAKLNLVTSDYGYRLNMENGNVPYIICQDIEYRMEAGNKEIDVTEEIGEDNVVVKIQSEVGLNEEQKSQLKRIAKNCKSLNMDIENDVTKITLNKILK